MEPSCESDTFFQIKTEEEKMEFELEDLHHSIDIKDETSVLEFKQNEECNPKTIDKGTEPMKYIPYKNCMVPNCTNTTIKTPGKIFLTVPRDAEVRKKWCIAMNRDKSKPVTTLSTLFCCEDHFTLKDDLENYWQHKLLGNVKLFRLNKGVVPHKFHCQEEALSEEGASVKRIRLEDNVEQTEGDFKPGLSAMSFLADDGPEGSKDDGGSSLVTIKEQLHKSIQVKPKYRSKGVSKKPDQRTVSVSTIKIVTTDRGTSPLKVKSSVKRKLCDSSEEESSSESTANQSKSSNEEIYSENSSDYSIEEEESDNEFKSQILKATLLCIEREPKLLIGVPKETYYIVHMLSAKSTLTTRDILITLKKIRLNESFAILALQFGMSISNVSRIFSKSVPVLANLIKELIVWMPKEKVRLHLPLPFRARYSNVQSIIDFLEIQTEKPINRVHEVLTWSQYKRCNTIKYLISYTPDGLINFISPGFSGRASEVTIVEECGFLEKLEPGGDVMTARGYKNMANILQQRGCNLIGPLSVSSTSRSTASEVKEAKRIAPLRIHVERLIGRLRDYAILLPHATVDNHLVKVIDDVVVMVCGLVNIQDHLIKIQL